MSGRNGILRVASIVVFVVVVGAAIYWGLGSGSDSFAPEPTVAPKPPVTAQVGAAPTIAAQASPVLSPTVAAQAAATVATPEATAQPETSPNPPVVSASGVGAAESPLVQMGAQSPLATVPAQPFPSPTPTSEPTVTPAPPSLPERLGLTAPVIPYEVVDSYPHDPAAFTQGLVLVDGVLYEGTGLRGASSLRRVDLQTGEVLQQIDLEPQVFGEGIAVFGDRIIQLTWTEGTAFVYDRDSFARLSRFDYTTEGWGLTHDGERLIMSDGTFVLAFRDPETFAQIGSVQVHDEETPIVRLNELEYVEGPGYGEVVLANVWQTDLIARIDPATGEVTGWLDMTGLLPAEERAGRQVDVLNGIAYDETSGNLLVTGKLWPRLYEIRLGETP